jgi:glycosyltransferase involved in cell wall biosynthesis
MGKKNNSKKIHETVSIVTITQIKRQASIQITTDLIKQQTYKKIIEWVIVEGSKTLEDSIANEKFINETLKSNCDLPIVYIPGYHTDESGNKIFNNDKLGALRNLGNKKCQGDITVCMDDDDYYPVTRVEHCVSMLNTSKALIAGCSQKYLYDYDIDRLASFKQFGPNHSTNDCMAWKREYLLENSHDPSKEMAEEASFTKQFANQMVQLDPKHCIVGSSHSHNTFSKKEIMIFGSIYANPSNESEGYLYPMTVKCEINVTDIMGADYYQRYSQVFKNEIESEYSIVYFCGGTSIEWDPTSESLGGSEQAVVEISKKWVSLGKRVAVYAKLTKETTFQGIDFMDWKKFPFHKRHNIVILWRMSGINCGLPFMNKSRINKLFVDYHDNNFVFRHSYLPYTDKIDRIFFKSNFHVECYNKHFQTQLESEKLAVIANGIRTDNFIVNPGIKREPFRFCYCSCYTRGLVELLQHVWPHIINSFPQAELHVYYGMNGIDQQGQQQIRFLLGQPGVMDHGRRPMSEIICEKWKSTFHLYITDCIGEIDCISIRESLVTGCIPLISKTGIFNERDGLHFNLERTVAGYQSIAQGIINLLNKPEFVEMAREQFKKSESVTTWLHTAQKWLEFF